jgi:hypothetical protein
VLIAAGFCYILAGHISNAFNLCKGVGWLVGRMDWVYLVPMEDRRMLASSDTHLAVVGACREVDRDTLWDPRRSARIELMLECSRS